MSYTEIKLVLELKDDEVNLINQIATVKPRSSLIYQAGLSNCKSAKLKPIMCEYIYSYKQKKHFRI